MSAARKSGKAAQEEEVNAEEEQHERLHRAGWNLGVYSIASVDRVVCIVEGQNGENLIRGEGGTLVDAYRSACEQARAVGMLSQ